MPLVNPEVVQLLKDKKHDYTSMSQDELLKIVKASSHQDAGNYGGQFVGFCAYMELVRKENNATFEQNKVLALNSIKIAKNSFYVAIVATIASIAGLAISFFK